MDMWTQWAKKCILEHVSQVWFVCSLTFSLFCPVWSLWGLEAFTVGWPKISTGLYLHTTPYLSPRCLLNMFWLVHLLIPPLLFFSSNLNGLRWQKFLPLPLLWYSQSGESNQALQINISQIDHNLYKWTLLQSAAVNGPLWSLTDSTIWSRVLWNPKTLPTVWRLLKKKNDYGNGQVLIPVSFDCKLYSHF